MERPNGPRGLLGALLGMMLIDALTDMADDIREKITDDTPKKQGDTVCLIDPPVSAYMTKVSDGKRVFDTNQMNKELEEEMIMFATQDFMVVESDLEQPFNCGMCDKEHFADLRIGSMTTHEEYYIPGNLVKVKE